eukprot:scaffold1_cov149-Alexandrium_tamarense.AAC.4
MPTWSRSSRHSVTDHVNEMNILMKRGSLSQSTVMYLREETTALSSESKFNVSRAATARGGEHAFLRWDEGTYDPWYRAPDFDWIIIKQLERQCVFFFCDLSFYMICPYFGWAAKCICALANPRMRLSIITTNPHAFGTRKRVQMHFGI